MSEELPIVPEQQHIEFVLDTLRRTLAEEIASLQALVSDEDADCISRDLRAERIAAFEYVLRIIETTRRWEW